ncbi:MAG: hypothetical protein WC823_01945 [Parcubacteria group bacterium]|jgi:hypothetical protein
MKILKTITRKELINFYLVSDRNKKNKPIPDGIDPLMWDDPNKLDEWLGKFEYKTGVITGFRQWAYVQISKEDFLDSAISDSIPQFKNKGQRLRDLVGTKEFLAWKPKDSLPIWYDSLSKGVFDEKFAIIVRPACESEKRQGAKFYIEDGSGRSICYLRSILKIGKESKMTGYIGFDPDPMSNFLQEKLDGEFSRENRDKYLKIENILSQ